MALLTKTGNAIAEIWPGKGGGQVLTLRLDRKTLIVGLALLIGYYLGARLGLALTFHPHPVSVMWPPNSILVAALLLSPVRSWFWLLLFAFPAHVAAELPDGVPLGMTLCWFVSNSVEALLGAGMFRLLAGPTVSLDGMRTLRVFIGCVVFLGPFLSSFADSGFVALNRFGNQGFWQVFRMRCCSNVFTSLTMVPVILSLASAPKSILQHISARRVGEAVVVFLGLLLVSFEVFYQLQSGPATIPALLYIPLPFLLWAAVRFGVIGTSLGILLVALLAIVGAVHGRGPFVSNSPEQNALSIQACFTVVAITLLCVACAISERARAEERFTKAFRSSPDAMVIYRAQDGRVMEANKRCEMMFGYQPGEIVGRNVSDLPLFVSPEDREKLNHFTAEAGVMDDLELCLRRRNGELRHTRISAQPGQIGHELCFVLVMRDVTDRKQAEEAQQNLAHASRLAVVGELTAMVAHEVNQPLGAILSNADAAELLLALDHPPLQEIRQILADIRKNDLRANEAIRHIRALLRKRDMEMMPLDLNETVRDVLSLVTGDALRRRIRIQRELAPSLPQVLADKIHLQQVLLNLIVNGMEAMNDSSDPSRQLTVRTCRRDDACLETSVSDCGHGIPADKVSQVFESFFSTKRDGMGLGLSIARSIIEAHQGRIWVENNQGRGVTFRFTLPLEQDRTGHFAKV